MSLTQMDRLNVDFYSRETRYLNLGMDTSGQCHLRLFSIHCRRKGHLPGSRRDYKRASRVECGVDEALSSKPQLSWGNYPVLP